jgi:hypothetical protein
MNNGESVQVRCLQRSIPGRKAMQPCPVVGTRGTLPRLGVLLTLLAGMFSASAQSYSIDWYKVAGGGGTSTGGTYQVSGTIGQHDASGAMTGGNYSVTGGFWALYAVQTPGAPVLSIKLTNNVAMVYWPSPSPGWTLQENTNSLSSGNWIDHPFPQDNGTIKYILVNPPAGNRYYRLKNP